MRAEHVTPAMGARRGRCSARARSCRRACRGGHAALHRGRRRARGARARVDLNVRAHLWPDADDAAAIAELAARAALVKASRRRSRAPLGDAAASLARPSRAAGHVARHARRRRASAVGEHGRVDAPARRVRCVDATGAGDAFLAGVLAVLVVRAAPSPARPLARRGVWSRRCESGHMMGAKAVSPRAPVTGLVGLDARAEVIEAQLSMTDPQFAANAVRSPRGASITEIDWADGHKGIYPHEILRGYCPCAGCQGHSGRSSSSGRRHPARDRGDRAGRQLRAPDRVVRRPRQRPLLVQVSARALPCASAPGADHGATIPRRGAVDRRARASARERGSSRRARGHRRRWERSPRACSASAATWCSPRFSPRRDGRVLRRVHDPERAAPDARRGRGRRARSCRCSPRSSRTRATTPRGRSSRGCAASRSSRSRRHRSRHRVRAAADASSSRRLSRAARGSSSAPSRSPASCFRTSSSWARRRSAWRRSTRSGSSRWRRSRPGLLNVAFLVGAFTLPGLLERAGSTRGGAGASARSSAAAAGPRAVARAPRDRLRAAGRSSTSRTRRARRAPPHRADDVRHRRLLRRSGPLAPLPLRARRGRAELFSWAMRLCDFPQGIFVMALSTAALPSLATLAAQGRDDELEQDLRARHAPRAVRRDPGERRARDARRADRRARSSSAAQFDAQRRTRRRARSSGRAARSGPSPSFARSSPCSTRSATRARRWS